MRCCICHRPLTQPAATIQSRGGPMLFGPDCARTAGLTVRNVRAALARPKPKRARKHEQQMELELEVSA